jgi:hypothetical protein
MIGEVKGETPMDPARELVKMQSFRELPEAMLVKRGA